MITDIRLTLPRWDSDKWIAFVEIEKRFRDHYPEIKCRSMVRCFESHGDIITYWRKTKMIRVTVELVSAIDESRNRILGRAEIANDGKTSIETNGEYGSYNVRLSKFGGKGLWKSGHTEPVHRKRRGPWDILYVALRGIVGERNKLKETV